MFQVTRRKVLISTGIAAPSLLLRRATFAADAAYPLRNINFIIPFAPGGGFDVYVRVVAPVMQQHLPRTVSIVPVNISAGGGARGIAQLYRARPDGYTIGIFNIPGLFILQQQQGSVAFDLAKFSWIGAIGEGERYLIAVASNSPLKTYADLKALSERRPVKFSATGPESTGYAATLIGTRLLDIRQQVITGYKGSADYIVAAMRGDSDAVIANRTAVMRFVRGNTVRILASFEAQTSLVDVPDARAKSRLSSPPPLAKPWQTQRWLPGPGRMI
jgi:tripartite-type tricarboxylate transporter receptor subunit TctC